MTLQHLRLLALCTAVNLIMNGCTAATHFTLRTVVHNRAGRPIPGATLSVPSLDLRSTADSTGLVVLRGKAKPGCRPAAIFFVGHQYFAWTFDPATPTSLDAGITVLSELPFEMPTGFIDGCHLALDSIPTRGTGRLDTLRVLRHE
jgi:hypothetical protein